MELSLIIRVVNMHPQPKNQKSGRRNDNIRFISWQYAQSNQNDFFRKRKLLVNGFSS
jgi:hypothetical protein